MLKATRRTDSFGVRRQMAARRCWSARRRTDMTHDVADFGRRRLALLELLIRGTLKKRRAQASSWDALAELTRSCARGVAMSLGLVEVRRGEARQFCWKESGPSGAKRSRT